jgi:hypothetical protein
MATTRRRRGPASKPTGFQEGNTRWRGAPRLRSRSARVAGKGLRVGDDLVEAFEQTGAHLRGEIELKPHSSALERSV